MYQYILAIIGLLAGLGAFLLGFKLLSDNMEKFAGNKLKSLFNKTSNKKIVNVGMGAAATVVVQSSSITTVMVVGFVNAGIMSLYQAAAVIMGANIGTTITAQIVAFSAFEVGTWLTLLCAIGAFLIMFTKKDKLHTAGYALAGLGLVFMALEFMSTSMEVFKNSPEFVHVLEIATNPFLLLFISIAFTALVQSSSAVTTIVITMASSGLLIGGGSSNAVLYIILGSNIGTCITAFISSIGANRNAKRACLFHLFFNVTGSILFMIMLLLWPDFNKVTFQSWFSAPATQIAMFHTFFNVVCALIFLPFTKYIVKLIELMLPDKKTAAETELTYMDERFLNTPALAIGQLTKEMYRMADMAMLSLKYAYESFIDKDMNKIDMVLENNQKIQKLSYKLVDYLIIISASDVSLSDQKLITALHSNNSDIVRIAELADNITKYARNEINNGLVFSDSVYVEVAELHAMLVDQYALTKRIVLEREYSLIRESDRKEDKIDSYRRTIINEHIERLNRGECRAESNSVFNNLVSNLERIGDHLSYMTHSMDNV